MFLFPWLDWGIDISNFEKIDFLSHWAIFGDFGMWLWSIFSPQVKVVANLRPIEYSDGPENFVFKKPNISAFERRVWNLYTTPRYEEPGISLKKVKKTP